MQYLHFNSCHPRHCKTSLPYSQAHRFRRICSNSNDFEQNALELKRVLTQQKYPTNVVDDAIGRARDLNRADIITNRRVRPQASSQSNLILTYTSNLPNVNNILRKHYSILSQSERLKEIFPTAPRVVYRRGRNLKDVLVKSKTTTPESLGSRPCRKPRCKVCKHMSETTRATSTNSEFTWNINGSYDCSTANVIYLLHCDICSKQYVGQTDLAFRLRFNNHKCHAKTLPELPLSKHLSLPNHSIDNISVIILESGFSTTIGSEQKESYFIYKFNTFNQGINESPGRLFSLQLAPS
ncbi:unnamed protein product [Ixodes hexagonus]